LQQRPGRVLGLLYVRLVERVDAEHGAGRRRRDLPAHELRADAQRLDQADVDDRMAGRAQPLDQAVAPVFLPVAAMKAEADEQSVVAVDRRRAERLTGNRHDAGPALAGRLGDELLDPQTEWAQPRSGDQRELVAPGARGAPQDDTERDAGILADRV